jgi:retron-type reverse transcriptase
MKRYGNLFNDAFTIEALHEAFKKAKRHKKYKVACFNFERRLSHNLTLLYNEIHTNQYKLAPYFSFIIKEPKERIIEAPAFRD